MRQPRTVFTFFIALSGFLVIGAGLVLLFPAGSHPSAHAHATATAAQTATPPAVTSASPTVADQVATPTALPGEFALLADSPNVPHPGEPSRIVIPTIGLDSKIVDVGVVMDKGKPAWDTAAFAVGYHRGSALPGGPGNSVMNGHISSPVSHKGDVFRHLPDVRIGDHVDVYTGDRHVTYEVVEVHVVPPTAVDVMKPTPDATLTLITCYPDNVYNKRLVVVGKLLQPPA